jgi:hypothetical protein
MEFGLWPACRVTSQRLVFRLFIVCVMNDTQPTTSAPSTNSGSLDQSSHVTSTTSSTSQSHHVIPSRDQLQISDFRLQTSDSRLQQLQNSNDSNNSNGLGAKLELSRECQALFRLVLIAGRFYVPLFRCNCLCSPEQDQYVKIIVSFPTLDHSGPIPLPCPHLILSCQRLPVPLLRP